MKKLEIKIDKIVLYRHRSRSEFAENEISETMQSKGLLLPISVRQEGETYVCFMGQGRYEAARKIGNKTITAYVYSEEELSSKDMLMKYYVDNLSRPKISQISKYANVVKLLDHGASMDDLAKKYGLSTITLKKGIVMFRNASKTLKNANQSGIIDSEQTLQLTQIKDEMAHEEVIKLFQERYYSKKDKNALIKLACKLNKEGKAVTANNIRQSIEKSNSELFALKENVGLKRNRVQLLNEYQQSLQNDPKFMDLITKNKIVFSSVI